MNEHKIKEILKEVKYPGFSRDIVSFGIIKEINFDENSVSILISLDKDEHKEKIKNKIINLISSKTSIKNILVNYISSTQPQTNMVNTQVSIPGVKHTIAIASGKGGVGKSTVAINLASILSLNYKVGILDLDIYGPSLPTILGINSQPKVTNEKKLIPIEHYGMKLMSFGLINSSNSPTIWRGPMVARLTQQFFEDVMWDNLDYLILDLPPGTGDIQLTLVQKIALSGAIIITTPQDLSLIDASKAADMFNKVNTPLLGIIENMSYFLCPHCSEKTEIFEGEGGKKESDRLNIPLLGKIMISPEISSCSDKGKPFVFQYKNSEVFKEYDNISTKIINILEN